MSKIEPGYTDKLFVIHPGAVRPRDGDIHHISAEQLIDLYRVNPRDCIIEKPGWDRGYTKETVRSFIHLYPKENGDYTFYAPSPSKEDNENKDL